MVRMMRIPQILASAYKIEHFVSLGIKQHAVDREIAPGNVLARVGS